MERCEEWCGHPPEYCDCKKAEVGGLPSPSLTYIRGLEAEIERLRAQLGESKREIDIEKLLHNSTQKLLVAKSGGLVGEVHGTGVKWIRGKAPEDGAQLFAAPQEMRPPAGILAIIKDQVQIDPASAEIIYRNLWDLYSSEGCAAPQPFSENKFELMLRKKLELIKCGIAHNYYGDPCENELYTEVVSLLSAHGGE